MPTTRPRPAVMNAVPFDLARPDLAGRRLHFVGIGGCGMSGLARMAARLGAVCSGSDRGPSPAVLAVRDAGIPVALEQTAASLPADAQVVVISAAIQPDHPEAAEALRRGLPVIKYAQLLGALMIGRTGVAIAGTHGKSTTTSLLCHILLTAGLDPSFIVGAHCAQIGGGWRAAASASDASHAGDNSGGALVAEACEYDRSFHNFHPTHGVILNVEADHLDLYENLDQIIEAFHIFAQRIADHGSLLLNHEMACRLDITAGLDCDVQTLGFAPQADWSVDVQAPPLGVAASAAMVSLIHQGKAVASWRSPMPGEHMAYNAAAAAVTAHRLGAAWGDITRAIESFQGLDRRMQVVGTFDPASDATQPVTVIDDYGHHPTEIDTTLRALRQHYQPQRLVCVFQPHQHSRTRFLMEQFAASFGQADRVIVPEIYFVRDSEAERQAVTAADLVARLRAQEVDATHIEPLDAIVGHLRQHTRPGDLVVTMGAGDVWRVAHGLAGRSGGGAANR